MSRVNPSEEQRLVKLRFEEKQRVEARKEAQAEKLAKKKVRRTCTTVFGLFISYCDCYSFIPDTAVSELRRRSATGNYR